METTKKRKRDGELPRITYDAATRTFDRLFKEESLDALKDVVRKKLNVSSSVPVHLSQLRDGKPVDLDDDDDFEAFSASAYSSSTVKVKVILGGNQTSLAQGETEPPLSSTRRKRKKKKTSDAHIPPDLSEEGTPPDSSLDKLPPSKKRRVSFAGGPHDIQKEPTETPKKDKKSSSYNAVVGSVQNVQEMLAVTDLEDEGLEVSAKKKEKKREKNVQEALAGSDVEEGQQTEPEGGQFTPRKKKSKKTDKPTTDNSEVGPSDVMVNNSSAEATQAKKSKKRSRTDPPGINDEDVSSAAKLPSTSPSELSVDKGDTERPSKKLKKHTDKADSDVPAPAVVANETSKSTKAKSKSPNSTTQEPIIDSVGIKPAKESKKSRKKKDRVTNEVPDNTAPLAPAVFGTMPEEPVLEVAVKKSKKPKPKLDTNESNTKLEMPPVRKSASQSAEAPPPQSSEDSLVENNGKVAFAMSQKVKKASKDVESDQPLDRSTEENAATNKDSTPRPTTPFDAKTVKKVSKKKKGLADSVESTATVQDKPPENEVDKSQVDRKELTRIAVEAILNRKAEQAKDIAQNSSTSSAILQQEATAAPVQSAPKGKDSQNGANKSQALSSTVRPADASVPAPMSPTSKDKDAQKKANRNRASSSASVQPTDAPMPTQGNQAPPAPKGKGAQAAKKSPATTTTVAQEKPKAPAACPVCDESPFHARSKCPVIKTGIRSMRKRIIELQATTSEENNEDRSKIVAELQGRIDKKTRKPRIPEAAKPISPPETPPTLDKEVDKGAASNTKSPFMSQPLSIPPSLTQLHPTHPPPTPPRTQRATSIHATSLKKAANTISGSAFQGPRKITEGPFRPDFLALGDVSLYTDQDIEALVRGPKVSLKDVPTSDTDDESEDEPEAALEEDEELEIKAPRNATYVKYPSSSDQDEEEEEEGSPTNFVLDRHPAEPELERDSSSGTEEMQAGNMSFQEVDDLGSSRELDRTGDVAANDAVAADLASPTSPILSQEARENEKEVDSDTAVASQAESPDPESNVQGHAVTLHSPPAVEKDGPDPIEPSEGLPVSQPETIVSDDERPMQSTPKVEVVIRTRSQRNKPPTSTPMTQPEPPVRGNTDAVQEVIKPSRKTRSLTKISEIPVPPNPSVRVIRPAPVPRSQRQLAQEEGSQEGEATIAPVEVETNTRPRRSTAAAAKAAAAKTPAKAPAKTPSKIAKTPVKPTTKAFAKTLAKTLEKAATANGNGIARTRSKPTVLPADSEEEEPSQANDTFVKSQEKKGTANDVAKANSRTKSIIPPEPTEDNECNDHDATLPAPDSGLASWAVLQESTPSRVDTETPAMIDELLPSPDIRPALSPRDQSRRGQKANGSSPEPLFVPAESQQSFPYSQYPDLLAGTQVDAFPNESEDEDDEDEVDKVVRPSGPVKPTKQASMFRGLSEIASQPAVFITRLSQQFTRNVKESAQDLYGQSARDSEESDSGTDSEAEVKAAASHIPAGRRAGVSVGKKK